MIFPTSGLSGMMKGALLKWNYSARAFWTEGWRNFEHAFWRDACTRAIQETFRKLPTIWLSHRFSTRVVSRSVRPHELPRTIRGQPPISIVHSRDCKQTSWLSIKGTPLSLTPSKNKSLSHWSFDRLPYGEARWLRQWLSIPKRKGMPTRKAIHFLNRLVLELLANDFGDLSIIKVSPNFETSEPLLRREIGTLQGNPLAMLTCFVLCWRNSTI